MNVDLVVRVIEVAALVGLFFGLACAVGAVLGDIGKQYPERQPFEQPRHVRIVRGDDS